MNVTSSETVARGWSKVVGESRDVAKDIEPTALGKLEVRREETARMAPTPGASTRRHSGTAFQQGQQEAICGWQYLGLSAFLLDLSFPSAAQGPPSHLTCVFLTGGSYPPTSVVSPWACCGVGVGTEIRDSRLRRGDTGCVSSNS
jgi:hypothetical protein